MVEYICKSAEIEWQTMVPQIYEIYKKFEKECLRQKQLDSMRSQLTAVLKQDDRVPNKVSVRRTLYMQRLLVDASLEGNLPPISWCRI